MRKVGILCSLILFLSACVPSGPYPSTYNERICQLHGELAGGALDARAEGVSYSELYNTISINANGLSPSTQYQLVVIFQEAYALRDYKNPTVRSNFINNAILSCHRISAFS